MIAKIVHGSEIHLYKGPITFLNLRTHSMNVFKALRESTAVLEFAYIDEEGDKINVSCQEDLQALMQSQGTPLIKKLYVEVVEPQFEELNPEEEPISNAAKIEVEEIVEIVPKKFIKNRTKKLSRFGREAMIEREAKKFYQELVLHAVEKAEQEEQQMMKEEVAGFMDVLIGDCSCKVVLEERKTERLEKCLEEIKKTPSNRKSTHTQKSARVENPEGNYSLEMVDKLVEEKLAKIIPEIVKRTARAVEAKIKIEGCSCFKKQHQSKIKRSLSLKY